MGDLADGTTQNLNCNAQDTREVLMLVASRAPKAILGYGREQQQQYEAYQKAKREARAAKA